MSICSNPLWVADSQPAGSIRRRRTTVSTNFRDALNDSNDLNKFDTAGGIDDLAAFDNASGQTHIPAGWHVCTIARGEVTTTKNGKTAYRLAFDVCEGPHLGFRLWRYFTFDTPAAANWAKLTLAPLGLKTSADLRKPFPDAARVVTVKILVTVREDSQWGKRNDVERFEVFDDRTAPPNPNAVDLDKLAQSEGGQR
jgi:hypothetical protein